MVLTMNQKRKAFVITFKIGDLNLEQNQDIFN